RRRGAFMIWGPGPRYMRGMKPDHETRGSPGWLGRVGNAPGPLARPPGKQTPIGPGGGARRAGAGPPPRPGPARPGPRPAGGAGRRGGSRAGDRRRDLDGNVPDAALQQSRRLAELVVPFRVVLVV